MQKLQVNWNGLMAFLFLGSSTLITTADPVLTVTQSHPLLASASSGANSGLPICTPDGRFVLFTSVANDLVMPLSSNPSTPQLPTSLNVYRRDRANGTTVLVSVNLTGRRANADSLPTGISSDGRYALFESRATDLVVGATNGNNCVFLRDLMTSTTSLVNVNTNGASGSEASRGSVMTTDGRHVAFVSAANDLTANDSNGIADVFVRDMQNLITQNICPGAKPTNNSSLLSSRSEWPVITPDGRFVAFYSTATNLVPGVRTAGEVYVRDLVAGTTTMASTNARSSYKAIFGGTNVTSCNQSISADGNYVAFQVCTNSANAVSMRGLILRYSMITRLTDVINTNAYVGSTSFEDIHNLDMSPDGRFVTFVANVDPPSAGNSAILVWDAQSGGDTLASVDLNTGLAASGFCDSPLVSSNGQFVAFTSSGINLSPSPIRPGYHAYVRDLWAGTTTLIDVNTNGIGSGLNSGTVVAVNADMERVVFESSQDDLVLDDHNRATDVFSHDLASGTNELVSAHDSTLESLSPNGFSSLSPNCVSTNGRYMAFASEADNLVPDDTNGCRDVFVRDLLLKTNVLVSADTNGVVVARDSGEPSLSGDGRYVAFSSTAETLAALDNTSFQDVFVRDLQSGLTTLVSVNTNGTGSGSSDSFRPTVSADGRFVTFHSRAQNLAAGTSVNENLFVRDLQTETTIALTKGLVSYSYGIPTVSVTPDGRYVAFIGILASGGTTAYVYVWDALSGMMTYTNTSSSPTAVSISADGQRLACLTGATPSLSVVDLNTKTVKLVSAGTFPLHAGLRFSADGRYLVFATTASKAPDDVNSLSDIYLHDEQSDTNNLVSRSFNSATAANGPADWPEISPDGRFVSYRSFAGNAVPGNTNGLPRLLIFDVLNGSTALATANRNGDVSADGGSLLPLFSGDSRTLVFQSWASDLVTGDQNQAGDIFSLDMAAWPAVGPNTEGSTNYLSAFASQLLLPSADNPYPSVIWPLAPGKTYQLQFKNDLSDPVWQDATNKIIFLSGLGYATDFLPDSGQRFYRVLLKD